MHIFRALRWRSAGKMQHGMFQVGVKGMAFASLGADAKATGLSRRFLGS